MENKFSERQVVPLAILGGICAYLLGKWGESMNLTYPLLVISAFIFIYIGYSEIIYSYFTGWKKVFFSKWERPFPDSFLGGIRVENNTWIDLKECKAELFFFISDAAENFGLRPPAEFYSQYGMLQGDNSLLHWVIDGKLEKSINIDKGKEGFIAFVFGREKSLPYDPDIVYDIRTTSGDIFPQPFNSGYIFARISAKVKDESLNPVLKRVRMEVDGDNIFMGEVEDV